MALKMMELSEEVLTPDGKPIKVNFHSFRAVHIIIYFCSRVLEGIVTHSKKQGTSMIYDVDFMQLT